MPFVGLYMYRDSKEMFVSLKCNEQTECTCFVIWESLFEFVLLHRLHLPPSNIYVDIIPFCQHTVHVHISFGYYQANFYFSITINRKCILLSRTSSARWLRIRSAGSRWKWSSFSFLWMWMEVLDWSNLYALTRCAQRMFFPPTVRHLGFTAKLLFSMLFRIFLKLCCKINFQIIMIQNVDQHGMVPSLINQWN